MNKKLLILTLPALMVLSGCNPLSSYAAAGTKVGKQDDVLASSMKEDTVAYEEDAHVFLKTVPLKAPTLDASSVKIGYQIQFNENEDDDGSDDTISIRFVAALKDRDVTAFWHRGLAQSNGYEGAEVTTGVWKYKFNDGTTHESSVFYDALNNGGDRVVAGEGDFVGYECFAIYTLMNIPYNYYDDSYLAAYVTLTGANTINSQGLAVRIERDGDASADRFYFNPDVTGHFLAGTINNVVRDGSDDSTHKLLREDETTVSSGENYASFSNIGLLNTDLFGAFYFSPTNFQFFGYDSFFSKSHGFFNGSGTLRGYAAIIESGNYNLYMKNKSNPSEENFVYAYANSYVNEQTNIWFYPNVWQTGGEDFRMYCWKEGAPSTKTWVAPADTSPTLPNGKNMYRFVFDPDTYDSFKFVRMRPGRDIDDWNDGEHSGDNARVWNESSNHVYNFIHTDGAASLFKINDWNTNSSIVALSDLMASLS